MSEPLRILMVEDVNTDRELAEWQLRSEEIDFVSIRVETEPDFLQALGEFKPDLIISDYSMPEFDGMRALQLTLKHAPDIPLIVLTGSMNEDTAVKCIKAGAADYVIKEHIHRLPFAVKDALKQHAILQEKIQTEAKLGESENRYRNLIMHSPDAIFVNHKDHLVLVNLAGLHLFGAEREDQLIGKSVYELFHPDYHNGIRKRIHKLRELGKSSPVVEEKIIRLDGKIVDVDVITARFSFAGANDIHVIIRDITERKRADAALKRKSLLQERMAALGGELAATLDLDQIYRIAERHLKAMVDCPGFGITLFDPKRELITAAYFVIDGEIIDPMSLPPMKYNPTYSTTGRSEAIAAQVPTIIRNLPEKRKATKTMPIGSGKETQSALYVPMVVEGNVIGLLDMQSYQPDAYSEEDGEWLSVVANQIGLTIQNARLLAQTRQRVAELLVLHKIDQAITTETMESSTYLRVLKEIMSQPYVNAAAILQFNPHENILTYAAGHGFSSELISATRLRLGEGFAGKAALERLPVKIFNPTVDVPGFVRNALWQEEGFSAYIGLPLISHEELKGVLEIFSRSPILPEDDWLHFMESIAQQVAIAMDNSQLFQGLTQANLELIRAYDATIAGWSQAMDLRDRETEGHTERVTELTLQIARGLGLSEAKLVHVRRGALLHDIGKLGVPDHILLKPGPLSDEEWLIMRKHPVFAYEMLNSIEYLRPALEIPYCHHEKWDGSGYPRGLKEDQIPLEARIFALVDVWDALTSDRPYRKAWSEKETLAYILEESGKYFDPELTPYFLTWTKNQLSR